MFRRYVSVAGSAGILQAAAETQGTPGSVQVAPLYIDHLLIGPGLIFPIGAGIGPAAGGDGAGAGAVDGFELVADALT